MLTTRILTHLSRPLLAVALIASSSTTSFGAPSPASVGGSWITTTSVAFPRYTEDYRFSEASESVLLELLAAGLDPSLDGGSAFAGRLEEIMQQLGPHSDRGPIELPDELPGRAEGKVIDKIRAALSKPEPRAFVGDYTYLDDFYPNVTVRGQVLVIQAGRHFVGVYREEVVSENINDDGDTAIERSYGLLQLTMSRNQVFLTVRGYPLSELGFQWNDLCVRPGFALKSKTVKKGLRKRKGWTVAAPHGMPRSGGAASH